jgi:TPR repeat protein
MENFTLVRFKKSFERVKRAAAKGHEESISIMSVVKDVEMEDRDAWKKALAKAEESLGWYFAGRLSFSKKAFHFYKKSAEGGCSWGQVRYGQSFKEGCFVEKDEKVYVEWLEKAANQNNPQAMGLLGNWFRLEGNDQEKAVLYYRTSVELGWKSSMRWLSMMFKEGKGCEKDLRQAVIWNAKGNSHVFWDQLTDAKKALQSRTTEDLDCDFDQFCYSLGWGLFWYQYETVIWKNRSNEEKVFGNRCLDFYCACVELQQKSIFTFLLCWNRTTGVKPPGQMIARRVWEGRMDNLLKGFEVRSK